MYESPINLFISDIASKIDKQIEGTIVTAVQKVGIDVDKDELIKALDYDRQQYKKGYRDGYLDGYDAVQRLKAELYGGGMCRCEMKGESE